MLIHQISALNPAPTAVCTTTHNRTLLRVMLHDAHHASLFRELDAVELHREGISALVDVYRPREVVRVGGAER
jgi:hypothetical protein